MSLGALSYRAVLRAPEVGSREVEQVYDMWLRESGADELSRPLSPARGDEHLEASARRDEGVVRLRALARPGGAMLWIDAREVLDEGLNLRAPALMSTLADAFTMSDADTPVRPTAPVIDDEQAGEQMLRYLWSEDRSLPLVLCTCNAGESIDTWQARADELARAFVGAAVVVAAGRSADGFLRRRLGPHLGVWGGAIRTYLPGVHPGLDRDASYRLAPVLPHVRAREVPTALGLLGRSIARLAFAREPPRLPDTRRPERTATTPEPAASAAIAELQGGVDAASTRLVRLEADVGRLDQALALMNSRMDELVDRLEHEQVLTPEPDDESAATQAIRRCGEAVVQADYTLEGVVIGADTWDAADRLDTHGHRGLWAKRAWRALQALDAYVHARRGAEPPANFLDFCHKTGAFYANRVTLRESETVRQEPRLRERRMFVVDQAVRQEGRILMEAHIAIGSGEPPAPRLYFHDDTHSGPAGKIHVGYLGVHLPNTQTN